VAPKKRRRSPRRPATGITPVPSDDSRSGISESDESNRRVEVEDQPECFLPRKRIRQSSPLPLSKLDLVALYACLDPLWTFAQECEELLSGDGTVGRPRESKIADVLLGFVCASEYNSVRASFKELSHPHTWNYVAQQVAEAYPDHPERRLSPKPPTRYQALRTRKILYKEVPGFREWYRDHAREETIRAALHLGIGKAKDSLTHPAKENMLMGDATWERSLYNRCAPGVIINRETGQPHRTRFDSDAKPFHEKGTGPGNYFVSVLARTEFSHERLVLDSQYKPGGVNDGTVFTDMALQMFDKFPTIRGAIYDMALSPRDQDRIGRTGRHAIVKVKLAAGKIPRTGIAGPIQFDNGKKKFVERVTTNNGAPQITVFDIDGNPVEVELVRKQSKLNGSAMYNIVQIPDDPRVPISKRGATGMLRVHSSKKDIEAGRPRPTYLRSIPMTDPDFSRLFGLREDTESMHNDYKSHLTNRRARSVGLERREFDLRGYQLRQMARALAAWSIRTGGDVSTFLGNWKPPEHLRLKSAA